MTEKELDPKQQQNQLEGQLYKQVMGRVIYREKRHDGLQKEIKDHNSSMNQTREDLAKAMGWEFDPEKPEEVDNLIAPLVKERKEMIKDHGTWRIAPEIDAGVVAFVSADKALKKAEKAKEKNLAAAEQAHLMRIMMENNEWGSERAAATIDNIVLKKKQSLVERDFAGFALYKRTTAAEANPQAFLIPQSQVETVQVIEQAEAEPLALEAGVEVSIIAGKGAEERGLVPMQVLMHEEKKRGFFERLREPLSRIKFSERPKTKLQYIKTGFATLAVVGLTAFSLNSCTEEKPISNYLKSATSPDKETHQVVDPKATGQVGDVDSDVVEGNVVDSMGIRMYPENVELADSTRSRVLSEQARILDCPYYDLYALYNDWDPKKICKIARETTGDNPGAKRKRKDGSTDIGGPLPVNDEALKKVSNYRVDPLHLEQFILENPSIAVALAHEIYEKEGMKYFQGE